MLTILIPMAGSGKRFAEAGYTDPKPLIPIGGAPMVARVINSLVNDLEEFRLVCVVRDRDVSHKLFYYFSWRDLKVIEATDPTDGAACTCLLAKDYIDTEEPLLIANCDQLVPPECVPALLSAPGDATVLTMRGDDSTKWSYAKIYTAGVVTEVAEKHPISDRATCGLYYFKEGADFVRAAKEMIAADDRTNGEFYVAPVLNYLIAEGLCVTEVRVEDHGDGKFHGLGTPEDLKRYLGQ